MIHATVNHFLLLPFDVCFFYTSLKKWHTIFFFFFFQNITKSLNSVVTYKEKLHLRANNFWQIRRRQNFFQVLEFIWVGKIQKIKVENFNNFVTWENSKKFGWKYFLYHFSAFFRSSTENLRLIKTCYNHQLIFLFLIMQILFFSISLIKSFLNVVRIRYSCIFFNKLS